MIKIKQKISKLELAVFPILMFFLCEYRFFYLISMPAILVAGSTNKTLLAMYSLLLFLVFIIKEGKVSFGYFGQPLLLVLLIVGVSTALSSLEFGYSLTQVLWGIIPYFLVLLYFPARKYLANKKLFEIFIVFGEISAIIMAVLFIYQFSRYTGEHSLFLKLDDMIPDRYIWRPYLGMRVRNIFDGFFRVFSLVIVDRIIKKKFKHCVLDILAYVSIVASVLIVDMSRLYLVIILLSSISILLYYSKKKLTTLQLFVGVIAIFGSSVVIIDRLSSIFLAINENTGSWFARVEAITHFISIGFDHFLLGIGMGDPEAIPKVGDYIRGAAGIYYPDDVGIIGLFASLGIIGVILYVYLLIKVYRCFGKAKKDKSLLFGVFICMLLSSLLSSYFDRSRILALVLTVVICDLNKLQR